MNKAMFVGNLVRDPELKTTQSGVAVCTFTVAVNRMRDANGESRADYLPVKTFKNRAENCAKYLSKGSKVAIEGPIQTYSYEAQDGSKRYGFEIVATEVMFLPSGNRSDARNGGGQTDTAVHSGMLFSAPLHCATSCLFVLYHTPAAARVCPKPVTRDTSQYPTRTGADAAPY